MFKKIAIVVFGVLIILILSSVLVATLYKKEINSYVVQATNKTLNARFSFSDASISLIKSFPQLSIELEEIKIIGKNEFSKDTLAAIKKLEFQVGLMKYFFEDNIDIKKIKVENADIHLVVLKDGKSNWDIVKKDSAAQIDTTQKKLLITLKKYELVNSNIDYNDQLRGFSTQVKNLSHSGSGDFTQDVFSLNTETLAEKLSISYLGKTYLSEVKATLKAPLEMNFTKMKFAFNNNDLILNDLPIHFDAWFAMPDSNIDMNVQFNAAKSPLKDFLSLVPILYQNSFKDLTASGNFTLNGYLKGRMSDTKMPGFGMELKIENGAFKYSTVPAGIKKLYLDFKLNNQDGIIDHSIIQINQLQMELNNQLMQANMLIKSPNSNPYIKANIKGDLDLGALLKIVPQKDVQLTGNIKANVNLDGSVNDFKKAKGYAKGNFDISQIKYSNKAINKQVQIDQAKLIITPQKLLINSFNAKIGKSDLNASGSLENYLLYFLKNENISGNLILHSTQLDLNELISSNNSTNSNHTSTDFELPKNIKFTTKASMDKVFFKDFLISEAQGGIVFDDQKLNFNKLQFNLLEASYIINGSFAKKEKETPITDLKMNIQNLSIKKAYKGFSLIQKFAPIAEAAQGTLNINMNFEGTLNNDLSPNLASVNSFGDMYINDLNLNGSTTINKISELVKWTQFKTLEIKPVHLSYQIQKGRFIVTPFDIITNASKINVKGSNGLDQTIDYTLSMDLPKPTLELGSAEANTTLSKITKAIKVQLFVTGNVQKPTIKVATQEMALQAKEIVKAEVKKQVDTKLDEAQKQADAIIQDAKALSDRIRLEAYAKADQMIADTKNPLAQMGIKLVADRIKKEADKKADKIIQEANTKAQEIINNAKNKNQ